MMPEGAYFETRLARREADLLSAQRLRYRVFVEELGADGDLVDHENRLERDAFDPVVDHLVLVDRRRPESDLEHVVGVYRLLPGDRIVRIDDVSIEGVPVQDALTRMRGDAGSKVALTVTHEIKDVAQREKQTLGSGGVLAARP